MANDIVLSLSVLVCGLALVMKIAPRLGRFAVPVTFIVGAGCAWACLVLPAKQEERAGVAKHGESCLVDEGPTMQKFSFDDISLLFKNRVVAVLAHQEGYNKNPWDAFKDEGSLRKLVIDLRNTSRSDSATESVNETVVATVPAETRGPTTPALSTKPGTKQVLQDSPLLQHSPPSSSLDALPSGPSILLDSHAGTTAPVRVHFDNMPLSAGGGAADRVKEAGGRKETGEQLQNAKHSLCGLNAQRVAGYLETVLKEEIPAYSHPVLRRWLCDGNWVARVTRKTVVPGVGLVEVVFLQCRNTNHAECHAECHATFASHAECGKWYLVDIN